MSTPTPRMVTRTTRRELVVIRFVETVSEVYEAPAGSNLPELVSPRPIVKAAPARALRLVGSR
jgi:hypothetical protein